jgi:hypothetical protein
MKNNRKNRKKAKMAGRRFISLYKSLMEAFAEQMASFPDNNYTIIPYGNEKEQSDQKKTN